MRDQIGSLLSKYDRRVPRYTSYPTAPHFSPDIRPEDYRRWLAALDPGEPLSLYLHIPFCDSLCWFCGCHTKVVRRHQPIARYLEVLAREIDLAADALGSRRRVCHLHFGGGTPTILTPDEVENIFARLRRRFDIPGPGDDKGGADIAVEIDPREMDLAVIPALARSGVKRASIGLQDLNPKVQAAVNRMQSFEETEEVVETLRAAGIGSINIDLMYGLPHQDVAGVEATIDSALRLKPDRLCLFGYAHVPWMKKHQRLIDEAALPGPEARFAQYMAAADRLMGAGYRWIGLDHFALPRDSLAVADRDGTLRRNFQGYTTDGAAARIGFGPSAIGVLPQGFVQNTAAMPLYREAVSRGDLPIARGRRLSDDDRLRAAVIEGLMCGLSVDLGRIGQDFGVGDAAFAAEIEALADMRADGLIDISSGDPGPVIRVTAKGRPFVRAACAVFDSYLKPGETRHARAV